MNRRKEIIEEEKESIQFGLDLLKTSISSSNSNPFTTD
jgi:hypothetical protein